MTAIDETSAGAVVGDTRKSTHDGGLLPVGDATWTLSLPHESYRDAVHAELGTSGIAPDVVEAGVRTEQPGGEQELFLTMSWLIGHPDLDGMGELDLLWSDFTGWVARADGDVLVLGVDELAAPAVLADAVLHLATGGLDCAWQAPAEPHRWEHAPVLEHALSAWQDQEGSR